jgi:hypothetical protein
VKVLVRGSFEAACGEGAHFVSRYKGARVQNPPAGK